MIRRPRTGRRRVSPAWWFLAPAIAVYTLLVAYPMVASLRLSLFQIRPGGSLDFVGFANFATLFGQPVWADQLLNAVANTLVLFAIHMLVQNPIGLLLAVLLTSRRVPGRSLLRGLIFAPTVLSVVIVGFIWKLIISPLWGIAEGALDVVGLGAFFGPWLGQEGPALAALSLMSVWQYIGIPMLLFSAALLSIPDEVLEAARVDGASSFQLFRLIQLPLILPTVGIVALLTFVGNINAFDIVYTVQGLLAGPDRSTDVIGTFFYRTFFGQFAQVGNPTMGATIATTVFTGVALVAGLYLWGVQRRLQRAAG